ncbi:trypsin-like peptidase domain-containing protein [Streptomyces sp. NPDC093595]|uniref:VMAP-C domain-containing protein n=1 Tax=Streptomyces sp. NPDC093595 TaxID=3366045 RepID=UPI003826985F
MHRPTPMSLLQELLESCRVRVEGVTRGAGFFVAPGHVVSCAHVTGARPGTRVPVEWRGVRYEGVVRAASAPPARPGRGLWPYPDLAVVEVPDAPAGHPCAWLHGLLPPAGTPLTAAGFSDTYEPGVPAPRTAELRRGGSTFLHGGRMMELAGAEVNEGLSGGPVLSHASGGVCGVVKATRLKGTDMGGLATPVSALRLLDPEVYRAVVRGHDRFHGEDGRWPAAADVVRAYDPYTPYGPAHGRPRVPVHGPVPDSGAALSGDEHRRLLALLASLPVLPAGEHRAAFLAAAATGAAPQEDYPLLDHRDVFTDLAAQMPPEDGRLPYELAYAADVAARGHGGGDAVRRLRDQVLIVGGRLGLGDEAQRRLAGGPAGGERPSVIGRVRHSLRDRRRYHVAVWRYRSPEDIVPAAAESEALPLQAALELLAELLPEQIDIMGGVTRPGLVELILPEEALDEGFPDWLLWPEYPWFALGRKQHVVVRPLERHEAPALHAAWESRWEHLAGKSIGEALVCVCGRDGRNQAALGASFDGDPALAAVALAGSPRSGPVADAYRVAVASGVPMMTWQRGAAACARGPDGPGGAPCGVPGRHSCPGERFLAQARAALAGTARDELPEKVCSLRNEAVAAAGAEEDHIGGRIVLLWDDPRRRIPRLPLAPAEAGEGPTGRT